MGVALSSVALRLRVTDDAFKVGMEDLLSIFFKRTSNKRFHKIPSIASLINVDGGKLPRIFIMDIGAYHTRLSCLQSSPDRCQ